MKRIIQPSYSQQALRPPYWLFISIMLFGILGYSAILGFFAGAGRNSLTLLLLLIPIGVITSLCALYHFRLVVLTIPIAALAIPLDLPTGTETRLPISLLMVILLTGLWCFSMYVRGWKLAPSVLNTPLITFGIICIISLIWGIIWRDPILYIWPSFNFVQLGALTAILMSLSAALLIGNFVNSVAQLKYITILFMVCCGLMTFQKLFKLPLDFLNNNGLRSLWVIGPAYALLVIQPKLQWYWRILLAGIILVTFYQTLFLDSLWISGWLPALAAILGITFFHSRKVFFVLLIISVIAGYQGRNYFIQVSEDNVAEGGLERLGIWEQNWQIVSAHWIFGTGPAGYAAYNMTYFREDARSTHNNYLDILAQFGFVGMAGWLWIIIAILREGWTVIQRAPPGFLRTLAITITGGWVGALTSMMLGDWILPFAYNQGIIGYRYTVYSWIFLGMLISIKQILRTQTNEITLTAQQ